MSALRVESTGLDRMIDQLDRLAKDGPSATIERLDAHLAVGFAATQAALAPHTKTGRTAASGVVMSHSTPNEWTGTVEYGIPGREGLHETGARWLLADGTDFLAPLGHTGEQVGEVIDDWIREVLED